MKNYEIVAAYDALTSFYNTATDLPIKVAYNLAMNRKTLEPFYITILHMKDDVIKQFGQENDDGTYRIPDDKVADAQRELDKLSVIDNEIELRKISINDLPETNIKPSELEAWMCMISEEE